MNKLLFIDLLGALFRVISEYKAKTLFCAPTALRMVKKEDPDGLLMKKYDLSQLKSLFLGMNPFE